MSKIVEFLNRDVSDSVKARQPLIGDVFGLELEMEGKNLWPAEGRMFPAGWSPHEDGSLRPHHGQAVEWVFQNPVNYVTSIERVDSLFKFLKENDAKQVLSNRTSTHVHFNVGDKKNYQLLNLYILYTTLEDILTRHCGDARMGNLFCLNSRDAYNQVKLVELSILYANWFEFNNNQRYAGLNLSSLNKFSSVEFRCMRGLDDAKDVKTWLSMIRDLCVYAMKMGNPATLLEKMSLNGCRFIVEEVFSKENADLLLKDYDDADIRNSMYEGMRLIQPIVYGLAEHWDFVRVSVPDWWAGQEEVVPEAAAVPFVRRPGRDRPNQYNPFAVDEERDPEEEEPEGEGPFIRRPGPRQGLNLQNFGPIDPAIDFVELERQIVLGLNNRAQARAGRENQLQGLDGALNQAQQQAQQQADAAEINIGF